MTPEWVVYGAGAVAQAVIAGATRAGIPVSIVGRNQYRVKRVARAFDVPFRVAPIGSPDLIAALEDAYGVVNTAGPFEITASPMLTAAMRARTHYVDLSNGWRTHAAAFLMSAEAARCEIAVLPGIGFGTYAAEALSERVVARVDDAESLTVTLWDRSPPSTPGRRATTRSVLAENPAHWCNGTLSVVSDAAAIRRDRARGETKTIVPITDGTLFALTRRSAVPNISLFAATSMPPGIARLAIPAARRLARGGLGQGSGRRPPKDVERTSVRLLGKAWNMRAATVSSLTVTDSVEFTVRTVLAAIRQLNLSPVIGAHTDLGLLGDQPIERSSDLVHFDDLSGRNVDT